jgi:PAS domain S-box-containing protein
MNLNIRSKIVLISIATLFLALSASTLVSSIVFTREYTTALQSKAFVIGQTLKFQLDRLLRLKIPLQNLVGFEEQCQELVNKYEDVSYAMIIDLDGKTLFHNDPSQHGQVLSDADLLKEIKSKKNVLQVYSREGEEFYDFLIPVFGLHDELIGVARIGFPLKLISVKIKRIVIYSVGFALIFLSFGLTLLIISLNTWVTKPLGKLISVIEDIRQKGTDSTQLVEVDSKDELGQLAQAFNQMIFEIRNSHEKIKDYARELEAKVRDRTVELDKTNEQLKLELSERKEAEEALKGSEKRFRDLVENSLVGIFIVQDAKIVYKNPEQERLFGPLPKSFDINDFFKIVHPDDLTKFKQFYETTWSRNSHALDTDVRFFPLGKKASKKEMQWVHCRASSTEYEGDKALLFNMVDTTRVKDLEQIVIIREKMASLGHVATGIAHEIRNPLSGINAFLDAIEKNIEDPESAPEIKEILRQTQTAANKIESVIKRVLDFSRPNVPSLRLADINVPIKEAINLSKVTLRKRGIKIETALDQDLPQVYIDPQLIEQVILNLITNSSEAMKDIQGKKNISIRSFMDNKYIVIEVSDSGKGIPSQNKGKIFEPFYTTKSSGSGVGLSFCQRIISDHGGTIEVATSNLGGAEFTIRIPIEKRETVR